LGFSSVTLLLLNVALWLDLLPDRNSNILEERKLITESLAVTYSGMAESNNPQQIRPMLEEIVHRTPGLLSAGIRDKTGQVIIDIGNHEAQWTNREGGQSTDSEIKVPLMQQNEPWGEIELHFVPVSLRHTPGFGILQDDIVRLFVFLGMGSFVAYSGFVWIV